MKEQQEEEERKKQEEEDKKKKEDDDDKDDDKDEVEDLKVGHKVHAKNFYFSKFVDAILLNPFCYYLLLSEEKVCWKRH